MFTAKKVDLRGDLDGCIDLTLPEPTPDGRRYFTLTTGTIDIDAESFFGRGFCHWLAGAIHSITGWDVYTIEYRKLDENIWRAAHSGVLTPAGTVLDIFGEHHHQDVCDRYLQDGNDTRPMIVQGPNVPGDVVVGVDHLRGDHLWWTEEFATPELQGMVLHFARLLLTQHGYGQHIRAEARPRPAIPVPPPDPPSPSPDRKDVVAMSIPEEVAQLNAIANAIPLGLLQQISEAEVPAELLAAREALSGGGDVQAILGRTHEATGAAQGISHAIAMLDRAKEAYQIVRNNLSDAFQSASEANQLITQAAQYHGRGQM